MDEDEEYADQRDQLLNRFRESLSKPMSERYFDEDDLIEIFDYAGDLNDDYLRMEALMCGARYFPDSEALLERRGIFYSQYSDETRKQFVEDNPPYDNLILETLSFKGQIRSDQKEVLDYLLGKYSNLSDEEVIQLVELAASYNQYEWLKSHTEELRNKAQYPNVVLYEIAIVAENMRDFEYSASLLEEMTQIEPFNSFYWMQLARQYAELGDGEKALSAIDYSLAIKPDSHTALLVKARLLYAMERPICEVVDLLNQAIKISQGDLECVRFLASVYNNEGQQSMAREVLEKALAGSAPGQELELIPDLLLYSPNNADRLFDDFYAASEDHSQLMWASWAQQLSFQGYPELAKKAINCFERNSGQKIPSLFSIEDSFIDKKFEDTIFQLTDYVKEIGAAESDFPAVVAMHIISMVKSGAFLKAYAFCEFFEKNFDITKYKTVTNRLEFIGLSALVRQIMNKLSQSVDPEDWKDYDPLQYWSD